MKALYFVPLAALAACATTSQAPVGMKTNQFVEFSCEGGKRFSARAAEDGSTVRVRYEGGWELDRKADGLYEADGWTLRTGPQAELSHNGKVIGKNCKSG